MHSHLYRLLKQEKSLFEDQPAFREVECDIAITDINESLHIPTINKDSNPRLVISSTIRSIQSKRYLNSKILLDTGSDFSLSIPENFLDQLEREGLLDSGVWLRKYDIEYKAFIVLQSQVDYKNQYNKGKSYRVPLKSKMKIGGKGGTRIIPITFQRLWHNLLVKLKIQELDWKKSNRSKKSKCDFLLFDIQRLSSSMLNKRLRKAFEMSNLHYRTAHDCRHSYGSYLYGETQSMELCKLVMGHTSEKVFSKYNHAHEMMEREVRSGFGNNSFSWADCLASG